MPPQFRPAAGADLVEDHRGGAADREAGGVGRQLVGLAGDGAAFLEEVGEAAQRRPVADPRVLADGGHLDHRHPGDVVLGASRSTRARRRGGDPVRPGLADGALEGGRDMGDEDVDDRVVGLEEAGLAAGEHLVEGLAADRRGLDHVGDRGLLVALGGGDPDHRLQQPLALGADRVGLGERLARSRSGPWIRCR